MKKFNYLKMTRLLFVALTLATSSAFAVGANSGGGGGNTLNGVLIENYQTKNPTQVLPNLEIAKNQLLAKLEVLVPAFAQKLHEEFLNRTWYIVPTKFNELPASRTGLRFKTDQSAYQNDTEVFISLPQVSSLSPESQIELFQHEIIMLGMQNKDERGHASVRKITGAISTQELSPAELSKLLKSLDFGDFSTKTEDLDFESLQAEYNSHLNNYCAHKNEENKAKIIALLNKVHDLISAGNKFTTTTQRRLRAFGVNMTSDLMDDYKVCEKR